MSGLLSSQSLILSKGSSRLASAAPSYLVINRQKVIHTHETYKSHVEILPATPEDAEIICDIRDRAWMGAYPNAELGITADAIKLNAQGQNGVFVPRRIAYLKQQLANDDPNKKIFVAKFDDKTVGFTDISIDEHNTRHIWAIYVDPEVQKQGIGGKLMRQVLDIYGRDHDILLEVVSYNQNAIDFYKHFGFEITDTVVIIDEDRPEYMTPVPQIEMVLKAKK